MLVVDPSVVVAALVDAGDVGMWAEERLVSAVLAGPHLLPAEVASVLRRAHLAGHLSADSASLAYADLLDLRVQLFAFQPLAGRVWALRSNVSPYDAWYVLLAESLSVPLATLDRRLREAPGPECEFLWPPS